MDHVFVTTTPATPQPTDVTTTTAEPPPPPPSAATRPPTLPRHPPPPYTPGPILSSGRADGEEKKGVWGEGKKGGEEKLQKKELCGQCGGELMLLGQTVFTPAGGIRVRHPDYKNSCSRNDSIGNVVGVGTEQVWLPIVPEWAVSDVPEKFKPFSTLTYKSKDRISKKDLEKAMYEATMAAERFVPLRYTLRLLEVLGMEVEK